MVVHPLRQPVLAPCPGLYDMDREPEAPPTLDMTGLDCCAQWRNPGEWGCESVRVDAINPEKFQYDRYRYQLYSKPMTFDCASDSNNMRVDPGEMSLHQPSRRYVQPTTDVRRLQQTTFIPVLPTKPGGERDVTFPMTPRTMGQPDVTTACCIPVMPCQPGFQNLTQHIKPTAGELCAPGDYCTPPHSLQRNPCQSDGDLQCVAPPSNMAGGGCLGLPDTFPPVEMRQSLPGMPGHCPGSVPDVTHRGLPHYTGHLGEDDGTNGVNCLNVKSVRFKDRVLRDVESRQETPEQRQRRLRSMYGHFGSQLSGEAQSRRQLQAHPNNITEQGNGFHWSYPQHENNLCYVLGRNCRC